MVDKIAYLCSSISWGGLEMNQLKNAIWMQQRGHEVALFALKDSPIHKEAVEHQIPFFEIQKHKKYFDFNAGKRLSKMLSENGFNHLVIRDNRDMSVSVIAKRHAKIKIKLAYFMEMQLGISKKGIFHTLRYRYIDLWSCPLNWLSEQVKSNTRVDPTKIKVIPSGLDFSKLHYEGVQSDARDVLEIPKDKFVFGLIGRFDPHKGHLLVLEAFKKGAFKDAVLCFLGEPNREEASLNYFIEIQSFIDKNGLHGFVYIRPFRKDVEVFYHGVDCCLMASKSETFGMVTIESLYCETPVIASNAGGSPELIEDGATGLLFESLNSDDLALKMHFMKENSSNFKKNNLRKSVEKFDANRVCYQVETALVLPHLV
jgi:glycosyltransferase involved in cell wall biosynthesis